MGFKIKKTVNGETVWESIKAKKYTASKTIERTGALPITINTDGQPLLDYLISGNTEQTGTPTPENPIMPNGCGVRTENLCDENNINQGYYAYADGQYGNIYTWVNTYYIPIKGNTEYTAKFETKYGKSRWYGFVWYDSDRQYISTTNTQTNPSGCELTATSPANAAFCVFNICSQNATDAMAPSDVIYYMLNEGSTAFPYEPYGYKLPMVSRTENLFDGLLIGGYFINVDFDTAGNNDIYKSIKVFLPAGTYTFSWGKNVNITRTVIDGNHQTQPSGSTNITSYTITSTTDGYVGISFHDATSPSTEWDVTTLLMLNLGSTPLPYVPYYREETPIYLGEVQTTRRIKKLVLTGEETFNKNTTSSSNYLYYSPRNALLPNSIGKTQLICNELPVINEAPVSQIGTSSNNVFNVIYVNFGADVMNTQPSGNTVGGLKEYLAAQYAAGTPVTVWYVLAEPETAVVNEPLMKISNYADTVSMEQTGVSIPTIAGTTIIDYNGTLKPSQMYIKYNSWSGWEDIDNYKIVNGNWTQDVT